MNTQVQMVRTNFDTV